MRTLYLDAVNAEARRQGMPTAPDGMENPVLVLRVTGGLERREDLTRFAELSNRWGGLERSGAEFAESDARKVTDALLALYRPDASGNLLAASNRPFMAAFLKEVGATGLTNADGTPTAEAALRVQRAMMAAVFGSDERVRAMVRDLMERGQELSLASLQNALMRSAGRLLAMKRRKGSFDVVDDVREAAAQYVAWRAARQSSPGLSLADFLLQQNLFSADVPPMQRALARLLEAGRFGAALERYVDLVAQQKVDAQSAFAFFEPKTPLQLLCHAERAVIGEGDEPVTPDPESAEAARESHPTRFSVRRDAAAREYDEVVRRYTKPDGSRRRGWMKTPNGKPTNLTERQWVQVRTPAFKAWFGDWEALAATKGWRNVADARPFAVMAAEDVTGVAPLVGKDALKRAFEKWGVVTNEADGRRVVFPNASAGKIERVGRVSGALKTLFEKSRLAWSESDDGRHPNISGIHHYLVKARTADGDVYVHFTVREDNRESNNIHSATVSSVNVYTKNAEILPGPDLAKSASEDASAPFTDNKIAYFLSGVNPDSVSKVVDENGEPKVVYHGSRRAGFSVFDDAAGEKASDAPDGTSWFSDSPEVARSYSGARGEVREYGEDILNRGDPGNYACFLDIRNPHYVDFEGQSWTGDTHDKFALFDTTETDEWTEQVYPEDGRSFFDSREEAEAFAEKRGIERFDIQEDPYLGFSSNSAVREAMEMGHDGAILSNIDDNGGKTFGDVATDYIAFSPNQIKSATDNEGAFDAANPDVRFSVRVNPRLREDIRRAVNGDADGHPVGRRSEVAFSSMPTSLIAIGLPDLPIRTRADIVRKLRRGHGFSEEQIASLPNEYDRPAAVFSDGNAYVVLTGMRVATRTGGEKPVMVVLRESAGRGGRHEFIASAYPLEEANENFYEGLARNGGMLFIDRNKVAVIGLNGRTISTLNEQADGNQVKTPEDLSSWSSPRSIPQAAPGAQGGARFSVGRLYTGSAADYERPSLRAVGTGEGAQVYGWGLYASTDGVARFSVGARRANRFGGDNGAKFADLAKGDTFDGIERSISARRDEVARNAALGLTAKVGSNRNANHLAHRKSAFGDENDEAHKYAAKNVLALFEAAEVGVVHHDKKGGETDFVRVFAPFDFAGETMLATVTLRRMAGGDNLYSVEAVETNRTDGSPRSSRHTAQGAQPSVPLRDRIAYYVGDVKATEPQFLGAGQSAFSVDGLTDRIERMLSAFSGVNRHGERYSVRAVGKYEGELRRMAWGLKLGQHRAMEDAARLMAPLIPENAVVVPMPNHGGKPISTTILAYYISGQEDKGIDVVPALEAEPHESNYRHKKRVGKSARIVMRRTDAEIPPGRPVVIVDNVVASGATYEAAQKALPEADLVTLADATLGKVAFAPSLQDLHREMSENPGDLAQTLDAASVAPSSETAEAAARMRDVRGNPVPRHSVTRAKYSPVQIAEALFAQRILAGKEAKAEDAERVLKSLGLYAVPASSVIAEARRLAETGRERVKRLVRDNAPGVVGVIAASGMEREFTDALDRAVAGGAAAADPEVGRLVQRAVQRKATRDLMSAKGFAAAQMMAELPIDLAKGVLAVAEYERTPEEAARLEKARKRREEERKRREAEDGRTDEERLADADGEAYREPTAEERAKYDELLDRARFAEEARKAEEERKRMDAARRKAEEGEGRDGDGDGEDGEDGGGDVGGAGGLPPDTVRRIAPTFEDADLFAAFLVEWTADHVAEKHPDIPSTAEMWKSPVAVRELKQTATHVLRKLARDVLGSPSLNYARNFADHAINELESDAECRTFGAVRRKIARIYGQIHDSALSISRRKMVDRLAISGNLSSAMAQPASIPVWANVMLGGEQLGFRRVLKYMTHVDMGAVRELARSGGARARYDLGWSEEVQNVILNPSRSRAVRVVERVYDKGMRLSQFADRCATLWIAQGFYRDAKARFLDR